MPLPLAMGLGAAIGAATGWLIGRAKLCSATHCRARMPLLASVLAGAFFGSAVAYALARGAP